MVAVCCKGRAELSANILGNRHFSLDLPCPGRVIFLGICKQKRSHPYFNLLSLAFTPCVIYNCIAFLFKAESVCFRLLNQLNPLVLFYNQLASVVCPLQLVHSWATTAKKPLQVVTPNSDLIGLKLSR